jgi:hypothetical protein
VPSEPILWIVDPRRELGVTTSVAASISRERPSKRSAPSILPSAIESTQGQIPGPAAGLGGGRDLKIVLRYAHLAPGSLAPYAGNSGLAKPQDPEID